MSGLRIGPDFASVFQNNSLRGGQSYSGSFKLFLRVKALEGGKQLVRVFHVEADAIIPHEDDFLVTVTIFSNLDHSILSWRSELYSIGEKVPEDLDHQAAVAFHGGKLRYFKIYLAVAKLLLKAGNHFPRDVSQVGFLELQSLLTQPR